MCSGKRGRVSPDQTIEFLSDGGPLFAALDKDWITLNFPKDVPRPWPIPAHLHDALNGAHARSTLTTSRDLLALFDDEQHVLDLAPNMERLADLPFRG